MNEECEGNLPKPRRGLIIVAQTLIEASSLEGMNYCKKTIHQ